MIRCIWVVACIAIAGAGCIQSSGPPKKACYPVKGQVFVGDKPAEGATVILHPSGATPEEWALGYPRGYVGSDGQFEVGTYGDNDGAPAGDYVMLISWPTRDPNNEEAAGVDRLGGRYSDPSTSKLAAKVESQPTELPPIRLP